VTHYGFALIGLTVIVAVLTAVMTFAFLRFAAAARDSRRHLRESGSDSAMLSIALQEAVTKLKSQEAEMRRRADASERLSSEIVDSQTAGLLVVDGKGAIEILNPVGRRLLGCEDVAPG